MSNAAENTLAVRLKGAREQAGLSQREVAEAAGLNRQSYQALEDGRATATRHAASLASVLGVSAQWLLGISDYTGALSRTNPALRAIKQAETIEALVAALSEVSDKLGSFVDVVDGTEGDGPQPNWAMRLKSIVDEAIAKAED